MDWKLDRNRAICPQLCEQICVAIASGEFLAGSKLPSVRDIALMAGVNPNTVQKALEQLSSQGVVYAERGSGWFVSSTNDDAKRVKQDVIFKKTQDYINELKTLGLELTQIKQYVKEWEDK